MAYKCGNCGSVDLEVRKSCWVEATDPNDPECFGDLVEVDYEADSQEFWCNGCHQHDTQESIDPEEYIALIDVKEAEA